MIARWLLSAIVAMLLGMPMNAEAQTLRFDLGGTRAADGYQPVAADHLYREGGYGFEPGAAVRIVRRTGDRLRDHFATGDAGFLFSAAVPEGNYRVTVLLGDPEGRSDTTVKAESRRLMLWSVKTRPGEQVERSFIVNVRNARLTPPPENAPGGSAVRRNPREQGSFTWDEKLTLEFLGKAPKVAAITITPAHVPTLFIAGDSTVTDQRFEPAASWGQMLPWFMGEGIAVANHAESGETLKSFLTELRLAKVLEQIRPGDYLLIQFGHNDQKKNWPQTYVAADSSYRDYLRVYAAEARRRGATPILVTSPERRNFDAAGRVVPTLGDYAEAARIVAREIGAPLVDLNAMSIAFYEALGPERAPLAFNDGGADKTHHDNYGAFELAKMVAKGLGASVLPLAQHLPPDIAAFDPADPDQPEEIALPPSRAHSAERPRGN